MTDRGQLCLELLIFICLVSFTKDHCFHFLINVVKRWFAVNTTVIKLFLKSRMYEICITVSISLDKETDKDLACGLLNVETVYTISPNQQILSFYFL